MGEVFELPAGRVEMELLDGVLHLTEQGTLRDLEELELYVGQVERWIERTGSRRGLIDARAETGDPPAAVREAMWAWLTEPSARGFTKVAFVLGAEMAVARVNMLALARQADVRAFDSLFAAQRWLVSARRRTTASFRRPTLRPPTPQPGAGGADERGDSSRASERVSADRASVERVAERVARRTQSSSSLPPAPTSRPSSQPPPRTVATPTVRAPAPSGAYSFRPDREERLGEESASRPIRKRRSSGGHRRADDGADARKEPDSDEGVA